MYVLALKLLLAPLLVVASSLAGRRWGPRLAGILVVLPIVAGPILLILYARAIATAALVVLLTGFAAFLGPALTSALAPFPIALSVVCAFTAAQSGHAGVLALLRGILPGLDGFALFCFLVAILINRVGAAAGVWAGHRSGNPFCGLACCSEARLKLVLVSDCHGWARHVSSSSGRG
jgi:hypothetical protein